MIPLPIILFFKKFWPYMALIAVVAAIAVGGAFVYERIKEQGRDEGRADIMAKWTAANLVVEQEKSKAIQAARNEERQAQKLIQLGKDTADAERKKLADRVAAFERDDKRLRIDATRLCKRYGEGSVPGATGGSGRGAEAAGNVAVRAESSAINLDDVAGEIGRLGSDLDAANIRLVEVIGIANTCLQRMQQKR